MAHQSEITAPDGIADLWQAPEITPRPIRVGIQGVAGAFHDIAARQFFGQDIGIVPALSFSALFEAAADPEATDAAVVAIENSIAGSILGNYNLLTDSNLTVTGEVYLHIRQNLLVLPGATLADLSEVHSHPIALAQCAAFFKNLPHIRLMESVDTAESAAQVSRNRTKHIGAIAGTPAAERYGLHILAAGIETLPENYTRFLVLSRQAGTGTGTGTGGFSRRNPSNNRLNTPHAPPNKASVCFTTPHEPGSLARILNLLAAEGANLTKIQSVPLPGRPWEYRFFADFTAIARIDAILDKLKPKTIDLRILGVYREGDWEITNQQKPRL